MDESLSLKQARRTILSHVKPLPNETIPLTEGLDRRPSKKLTGLLPVPHFRQSTMDGYAVHSSDIRSSPTRLPVMGEIAAGCTEIEPLSAGQAIRIMTGGAVPPGADQVIPYEHCKEEEGQITVFRKGRRWNFIRNKGTDLKKGQLIVKKGSRIAPIHLQLLATSGHTVIPAFKRPSVAFLCTGSELVDSKPHQGQLISGNRSMLMGLIKQTQSLAVDLGTAVDDTETIAQKITAAGPVQVIITTGGMGPGKYDLIKEVCSKIGVQTIYHSLNVRPGRATLFGVKKNILFFGLPGPPPAAYLLFEELVRPALLAFQGYSRRNPPSTKALLQEEITIKKRGLLNLKSATLYAQDGKLYVRPHNSISSPPNAAVYIPSNRRRLRKGELVTAHCFDAQYLAE